MVLLVGLGAVACGGESEIQRGIYKLEVVPVSDSCAQPRASGDLGEAMIGIRPEGPAITLPVQNRMDAPGVWAYEYIPVPVANGFTQDRKSPKCDSGVEHRSLEWLSDRNPLEVRRKENWTGMAGCDSSTRLSEWPQDDCATETTLRYTLVKECPEKCTLNSTWELGQTIHYTCDCG